MSARRVRADLLVGRMVRDATGARVGRIRELLIELAAPGAREYVVREVELATGGVLDRVLGPQLAAIVRRRLGRPTNRVRVPWEEIDLTNPQAPRLRR